MIWLNRNAIDGMKRSTFVSLQRRDPVQLASYSVKSTKLWILSINIMRFFFYKSRTNPRNLKYLILTSPFAVSKVKAAASKTFLLSPSNKMTSYLWNFLLFDNLAEVHLKITQHLLDTKHLKCFLYIYIHDFFLLFKEIFPFLKKVSLLPWGFAKDVSWL